MPHKLLCFLWVPCCRLSCLWWPIYWANHVLVLGSKQCLVTCTTSRRRYSTSGDKALAASSLTAPTSKLCAIACTVDGCTKLILSNLRRQARSTGQACGLGSKECSYWVKSFCTTLDDFISKCLSRCTVKSGSSESAGLLPSAALLCLYKIGCCGDLEYLCTNVRAGRFKLLGSC